MRKLPALFVLGALAFAGCGGDTDPVRAPDGVVRVVLDEYKITPQDISVPAGRVRLVARNDGILTHNLAVEADERAAGSPRRQFGRTPTARPGETVRGEVTLAPGTYRLSCTLANHDDLGQFGTLQVTAR